MSIAGRIRPVLDRTGQIVRAGSAGPVPRRRLLAANFYLPVKGRVARSSELAVHLVAELAGERLIGIEIEADAAPMAREHAKHLLWLRDELGQRFVAGVVFHTGQRLYELDAKIVAVPISGL